MLLRRFCLGLLVGWLEIASAAGSLRLAAEEAIKSSLGVPFQGVVSVPCGDQNVLKSDEYDLAAFSAIRGVRWQNNRTGALQVLRQDGATTRLLSVPFCVDGEVKLKVARTALRLGQTVDVEAYTLEWRALSALAMPPTDFALERQHTVMRTRRNIESGEVLFKGNVALNRSIERGDRVVLRYRDGPIELEVDAIALASAGNGERISVRPLTSRTAISAWVTAPGRAEFRGAGQ